MRRILLPLLLLAPLNLAQGLEDALFGGDADTPVVTDAEETDFDAAAALLESERVVIGGNVSLSADLFLNLGEASVTSGLTDLSTRLFLDARPDPRFRALIRSDVGYSARTGLELDLREMFADFDVDRQVFFRAGKQTINWGVGYFFSPANLVNIERVDPEEPGAELAGPVAFRAQYPIGISNLSGTLILDDLSQGANVALATRYEFLVQGYEMTVGGVAGIDRPWAVMATATGNLAGVTVFAEAVLRTSDRIFVVADPDSPLGIGTETRYGSVFFQSTVGGRSTYTHPENLFNLSGSAQYYFNGLGYRDPGILSDNAAVGALLQAGELRPGDLAERGRHYLGLSLSSRDIARSAVDASAFWLAGLSDGSGSVSLSVGYGGIRNITPQLTYRYNHGRQGSEFAPAGRTSSIGFGLRVSGSF